MTAPDEIVVSEEMLAEARHADDCWLLDSSDNSDEGYWELIYRAMRRLEPAQPCDTTLVNQGPTILVAQPAAGEGARDTERLLEAFCAIAQAPFPLHDYCTKEQWGLACHFVADRLRSRGGNDGR